MVDKVDIHSFILNFIMTIKQLLLWILLAYYGGHTQVVEKIHGGIAATAKEFPYLVKITLKLSNRYTSLCTGSYVNKLWVLSASHCVKGLSRFGSVYCCMGSARGCHRKRKVDEIYIPKKGIYTDLMMMKLYEPFVQSETIQIGTLPTGRINVREEMQEKCIALGFGKTGEARSSKVGVLMQSKVELLSHCAVRNCLCVVGENEGPCKGDSGSPLLGGNRTIIGVLSAGSTDSCGLKDVLFIYVRVDDYLPFIEQVISESSPLTGSKCLCGLLLIYVFQYF